LGISVKASNLPKYHVLRTPNSYALATIDGGNPLQQRQSKGRILNGASASMCECHYHSEELACNVDSYASSLKESSTITVQLFHVVSPPKVTLRATALISVKDSLPQEYETTGMLRVSTSDKAT
jgi:hypothetical protein